MRNFDVTKKIEIMSLLNEVLDTLNNGLEVVENYLEIFRFWKFARDIYNKLKYKINQRGKNKYTDSTKERVELLILLYIPLQNTICENSCEDNKSANVKACCHLFMKKKIGHDYTIYWLEVNG